MGQIIQADWPQIQSIYRTSMQRHFPANELKPESTMERMFRDGCYDGFLYQEAETTAGYAFFFRLPEEPAVLLDFLALEESFRGQKRGSRFLTELRETAYPGRDIYLEIDDPDFAPVEEARQLWLRRWEFYRRLGAVDTGVRSCIWEAPYRILCFPAAETPGADAVRAKLRRFYPEMYGPEVYEKSVAIQ